MILWGSMRSWQGHSKLPTSVSAGLGGLWVAAWGLFETLVGPCCARPRPKTNQSESATLEMPINHWVTNRVNWGCNNQLYKTDWVQQTLIFKSHTLLFGKKWYQIYAERISCEETMRSSYKNVPNPAKAQWHHLHHRLTPSAVWVQHSNWQVFVQNVKTAPWFATNTSTTTPY